MCRSLLPARTRTDKRERERAESAEREQRERRREMSQQPKWKLHKGPSNPSILVGEKGFLYARNEFIDSEDVEEKTTSFYQNRAIEAYWMQENQRARERGRGRMSAVSYTHLTLPTILRV